MVTKKGDQLADLVKPILPSTGFLSPKNLIGLAVTAKFPVRDLRAPWIALSYDYYRNVIPLGPFKGYVGWFDFAY